MKSENGPAKFTDIDRTVAALVELVKVSETNLPAFWFLLDGRERKKKKAKSLWLQAYRSIGVILFIKSFPKPVQQECSIS